MLAEVCFDCVLFSMIIHYEWVNVRLSGKRNDDAANDFKSLFKWLNNSSNNNSKQTNKQTEERNVKLSSLSPSI